MKYIGFLFFSLLVISTAHAQSETQLTIYEEVINEFFASSSWEDVVPRRRGSQNMTAGSGGSASGQGLCEVRCLGTENLNPPDGHERPYRKADVTVGPGLTEQEISDTCSDMNDPPYNPPEQTNHPRITGMAPDTDSLPPSGYRCQ